VALNLPPDSGIALHEQLDETDRGLVYDLSTLLDRRQVLKLAGLTTISAGLMSIVACAPSRTGSSSPSSTATGTSSGASGSAAAAADCAVIPIQTLSQVSLTSDNVFGDDGGIDELGTVAGDVSGGMTVALTVPVKAA
jgi:3D (Asp-Asp-Asp) domain-containing protein